MACRLRNKIPIQEIGFLLVQRNERFFVGSIGLVTTKKIKLSEHRKEIVTKTLIGNLTQKQISSKMFIWIILQSKRRIQRWLSYEKNEFAFQKLDTANFIQIRLQLPANFPVSFRPPRNFWLGICFDSAVLKDSSVVVTHKCTCKAKWEKKGKALKGGWGKQNIKTLHTLMQYETASAKIYFLPRSTSITACFELFCSYYVSSNIYRESSSRLYRFGKFRGNK